MQSRNVHARRATPSTCLGAALLLVIGCGPGTQPEAYRKLTPEEHARMAPEDMESLDTMQNLGDEWKDRLTPENAPNPRRRGR